MTLFGTGKFQIRIKSMAYHDRGITHSTGDLELEVKELRGETQVLTPDAAIRMARDSKLTKDSTRAAAGIQSPVRVQGDLGAALRDRKTRLGPRSQPDDVCLGTLVASSPIKPIPAEQESFPVRGDSDRKGDHSTQ